MWTTWTYAEVISFIIPCPPLANRGKGFVRPIRRHRRCRIRRDPVRARWDGRQPNEFDRAGCRSSLTTARRKDRARHPRRFR